MNSQNLFNEIRNKKSFLCIGLDSEFEKLPEVIRSAGQPQFEFNREIVKATYRQVIAYKINTAFYEARGGEGWEVMAGSIKFIRSVDPDIFIIADAKRGDIGNTAEIYAKAFFDLLGFDAVTLSPYMGFDSIYPFLKRKGKWSILLAVTSNPGAEDFQFLRVDDGETYLYEKVVRKSIEWGTTDNIMYVVGGTRPEKIRQIRKHVPDHFLLIPGIGTQGASLEKIAEHGLNSKCGLIVNASRSIIFADNSPDFALTAHLKAAELQQQMESILKNNKLI